MSLRRTVLRLGIYGVNIIVVIRTHDLACRLVVASGLLLPGYGTVVGGLAHVRAENKARCAPALKSVVGIRLGS